MSFTDPLTHPITTANLCVVGVRMIDGRICIGRPPEAGVLTKREALNLAAWLVALADEHGRFDDLLDRVRNT